MAAALQKEQSCRNMIITHTQSPQTRMLSLFLFPFIILLALLPLFGVLTLLASITVLLPPSLDAVYFFIPLHYAALSLLPR